MAITVNQQPASPNFSRNELVFNLSTTNLNEDEFSFVVDTSIGGVRVDRRRKQPSPVGRGVFDMTAIVDANLDPDLGALGSSVQTTGGDSVKSFVFTFREEFRRNNVLELSGELASVTIIVIKGAIAYNSGLIGTATIPATLSRVTNDFPIRVHRSDDMTISYYDSTLETSVHAPIAIPTTGATYSQTVNSVVYNFQIYDTRNDLGEDRFAWFNDKGGWDYFTFDQEGTELGGANKSSYNKTQVNFGRATTSNREGGNASVYRGGTTTYAIDYTRTFSKNSRWFNDLNEAEWVTQIIDSPFVYRQMEDGTWAPVTILNSSYEIPKTARVTPNNNLTLQWRFASEKRRY